MYIGSTGVDGLHHLIKELLDNAVDEALAGHCDRIDLHLAKDGAVTVSDNGRGIPVDVHPDTGVSGLETVMTTLHAGGKFDGAAYKVSGGLHGVGASVVNALASQLHAEVYRGGHRYTQDYSRGIPSTELVRHQRVNKHGTTVTYRADPGHLSGDNLRFWAPGSAAAANRVPEQGFGNIPGERVSRGRAQRRRGAQLLL